MYTVTDVDGDPPVKSPLVTVAPREVVLQFGIEEQARDDAIAMVWDQVAVNTLKTMTLGGGGGMQAAHLMPMLVHTMRV